MELGLYHEFPCSDENSQNVAFSQGFEQIVAADRGGLDVAWLAELHLNPKRSVVSSPLLVASAIAAMTSRIKIGIAVQVLPLAHPLRIAAEAATVDQISRGRLIFGVGRSGNIKNYAAYGVPYEESHSRFWECLDIIKQAWTEPHVTYEGRHYRITHAIPSPKPFQAPHPPIRLAASSPESFATIGKLGYPILVACRVNTLSDLRPDLEAYRGAFRAANWAGEPGIYLRLPMHLAETDRQAETEAEESFLAAYSNMGDRLENAASERVAREEGQHNETYEKILHDKVVAGSPPTVVKRLKALQDELGLAGILAELNFGALIPHEKIMRSLKLLCDDVRPHLPAADPHTQMEIHGATSDIHVGRSH